MAPTTDFARWLDIVMSNRGISGRDLAKEIDVHDSAVSRWRSGKSSPNMGHILKLADALEVPPLALAATAGLLPPESGVRPLDIPPAYAQRERVRQDLQAIKGINSRTLDAMLEAFDRETRGENAS